MNVRTLRTLRAALPLLAFLPFPKAARGDAPAADPKAESAPTPRNRHLTLEKMLRVRDGASVGQDPGDFAEARRAIDAEFHPTTAMITSDSKPAAIGKQIVAPTPEAAPPGRVNVAPHGDLDVAAQVDASYNAINRPSSQRSVEVTAIIDREGRIVSIDVTIPSGSGAFDRTAIDCVRTALRDHPSNGQRTALRTRWRLTAGRSVRLPRMGPMIAPQMQQAGKTRDPVRFGFGGSGGINFDESSGRITPPAAPFSDRIETRVELISVETAPE